MQLVYFFYIYAFQGVVDKVMKEIERNVFSDEETGLAFMNDLLKEVFGML